MYGTFIKGTRCPIIIGINPLFTFSLNCGHGVVEEKMEVLNSNMLKVACFVARNADIINRILLKMSFHENAKIYYNQGSI